MGLQRVEHDWATSISIQFQYKLWCLTLTFPLEMNHWFSGHWKKSDTASSQTNLGQVWRTNPALGLLFQQVELSLLLVQCFLIASLWMYVPRVHEEIWIKLFQIQHLETQCKQVDMESCFYLMQRIILEKRITVNIPVGDALAWASMYPLLSFPHQNVFYLPPCYDRNLSKHPAAVVSVTLPVSLSH